MATEMEALTARMQRVEDELAIRRVILSYGPAADAGETARAGALWADDGEYDWDPDRSRARRARTRWTGCCRARATRR